MCTVTKKTKHSNSVIKTEATFIEKDNYYALCMCMYVLKIETVSSCYLMKKSWKHFENMIKCFTKRRT